MEIIEFLKINWQLILGVLAGVYELVIRIKPTLKSKSIFNLLAFIFDSTIPNRASGGGSFKLETKQPKNTH